MRRVPVVTLALLASLAGGLALHAAAASSPADRLIAPALGNHIISTHPDGRRAVLWLAADHTYRAQGRKGEKSSGVWTTRGSKVCLSQRKPHRGPFPYCKPLQPMRLGMTWRERAFNGEKVVNRLAPGG